MATDVFDEVRFIVIPPAGALAVKLRVRFCGPVPRTIFKLWAKLTDAFT